MIFQPWVGQFGSEGGSNFTLWDSREPKGTVVLGNKSFCYFAVLQIKISRKEQFSYTGPYLFCDNLQKFQAQHHVLYLHTLMYLLRQNFLFPAILYYLQNSFDPKFESISYFSQVGNHVYIAKGSGGGVITMKNADRTFLILVYREWQGLSSHTLGWYFRTQNKFSILEKEQIFRIQWIIKGAFNEGIKQAVIRKPFQY